VRRLLLAMAIMVGPVLAHEAPTGWTYDRECCGEYDCHVYPSELVEVIPGGYKTADGEVVMEGDKRLRWSKDGNFHRCDFHDWATPEITGGHKIRCFYKPPNAAGLQKNLTRSDA
jgi:hypothetical protein